MLDLSVFDSVYKPFTEAPEKPEWEHWIKMSVVTIKEACWLSIDIDPRTIALDFNEGRSAFIEFCGYHERLQVIQSALVCKELKFIAAGKNYLDGMVRLPDFVELAVKLGYCIPLEMQALLSNSQSTHVKENTDGITKDIEPNRQDKELDGRERNNLLKIIAALCEMNGKSTFDKGLDREILLAAEKLGLSISLRTIAKQLENAKFETK